MIRNNSQPEQSIKPQPAVNKKAFTKGYFEIWIFKFGVTNTHGLRGNELKITSLNDCLKIKTDVSEHFTIL